MNEPKPGSRTQVIVDMLRRQLPNGLTSKQIRQRLPDISSRTIHGILRHTKDGGLTRSAEVFGVKTWFAQAPDRGRTR